MNYLGRSSGFANRPVTIARKPASPVIQRATFAELMAFWKEKEVGQKQAADQMAKALASEGMELTHIIGPKTRHAYHAQSKPEINRRLDAIVAQGRNPVPEKVRFTTWTLRYNQMLWVTVDGLEEHWERARVEATTGGASSEGRGRRGRRGAHRVELPRAGVLSPPG